MKYGLLFATLSTLLAFLAVSRGNLYLLCLWPALSFAIVALGYLRAGPKVYGKAQDGVLSPFAQFLLLPYLLYLWAVWYMLRMVKREPPIHRLTDTILIGRRLLSHELPGNIDHVVDLTCEFNEPKALRSAGYHSFQILDGFVPPPSELREWSKRIANLEGTVFIHCAEGHGRTGLVAASVLLRLGHSRTPTEAIEFIKSKRPLVRLGRAQFAALMQCGENAEPSDAAASP